MRRSFEPLRSWFQSGSRTRTRSVATLVRGWVWAWVAVASVGFVLGASAHVVMGTKSLHLRVAEAELIVLGRVVDPAYLFVSEDGNVQRALVEIDVLEALKGEAGAERLRFAQDGHAVARYEVGETALFFLRPIARSRELRALVLPGGPSHVSGQEHDEEFLVAPKSGSVLLSATRAFADSERAETTEERVALIRGATLDLLTSSDDRLASSALASLVMAPSADWVADEDMPRIRKKLADPSASIGLRAGLIAELDRRGLISGDEARKALLEEASPASLPAAIRALATRPSAAMTEFLLDRLLNEPLPTSEVAAEGAIALGNSNDPRVATALGRMLTRKEARVRNAAIRGLRNLGTSDAIRVLRETAERHADPSTRRRAEAAAGQVSPRS